MPRKSRKNNYAALKDAVLNLKQVNLTYNHKRRVVYPIKLGYKYNNKRNRNQKYANVLCIELVKPQGVISKLKSLIGGDTYVWRAFKVNSIDDLKHVDDTQRLHNRNIPKTKGNPTTSIDELDVEVPILGDDSESEYSTSTDDDMTPLAI